MKQIKIIDFSTLLPGPFSTYLLEKYAGAKIIKVEDSSQGDPLINMRPSKGGVGLAYKALNAKKKIISIDLRRDGLEKIKSDLLDADIFIHNQKSSRAFKLGLGFEDIKKINPNIIYCSISGFGSTHPLSTKSAHDLNILALSGYIDQGGNIPPLLLADVFTGHHIAVRLLAALVQGQTGVNIDVSMWDSFQEAMIVNNAPQLETQKDFQPDEFPMSGRLPCYSIYETKDKGRVAVAALEKPLWVDFCHHIGRDDLVEKQFEKSIVPEVAKEMLRYDKSHWLDANLDFCITPVLSILEAKKQKYV